MIRITVESDHFSEKEKGALPGTCSLEISGHSLMNAKGSDILCAAVSVLGQTLVVSVAGLKDIGQSVEQKDGFLKADFDTHKASGESRQALGNYLDFIIRGIIELKKQYPDKINLQVNDSGTVD